MKKLLILLFLLPFLFQCGKEQSLPPSNDNTHPYIQMEPPIAWDDNTPLIPERDLKLWKIYALNLDNNTSSWFTAEDEIANVEMIYNNLLVTEFNLDLLRPYLKPGEYMLGIRVLAIDGQQSDFADNTVLWEYKEN